MATTTFKGAYLPTVAGDVGTWGTLLNTTTFPIFDSNLGGIVTKSLAAADVTLSAAESQNAIVRLTGVLPADRLVTTAAQGFTFVENATSGAFTVTFTNGVGTPVIIPQGERRVVILDATNGPRTTAQTLASASTTVAGVVELATDAETITGTSTTLGITPANLQALTATATRAGIVELATGAETIALIDTTRAITAADLASWLPAHEYAEYALNADITAAIPVDDTKPQVTEGTEIISKAVTLHRDTNIVTLTFCGQFTGYDYDYATVAIFRDGAADAIFSWLIRPTDRSGTTNTYSNITSNCVSFKFDDIPGTTSPVTYSVRVGPSTAGKVLRLNGLYSSRVGGGASKATLSLDESYA